ncbi:MAG: YitT family protein [Blautia glucerasea]|nr:YitT family protein [Blautia glucerasea]
MTLKQALGKMKWKNFFFLTVAGMVNAFGVTMFIAPVDLYDSGISGTSILLSQLTPEWLSLSLFLLVLNIPLFLYGLKKQGVTFTIYAIYTVAVYSFGAWLITDVLPVDVSIVSPLAGSDLLLCAIFGGLISGIGSGMAIRFEGAMDGIEVLAVIFAKRLGITVGTFVMAYNLVLYIVCGFVLHSWILPLYSIVAYGAALKTVDFIVEGLDRSKAATIVTVHPNEVCAALSEAFECGMTITEAKGYYSDSPKTVVYIVVNRFQVGKMKELVHENDRSAYISIAEIADVYGANTDKV